LSVFRLLSHAAVEDDARKDLHRLAATDHLPIC